MVLQRIEKVGCQLLCQNQEVCKKTHAPDDPVTTWELTSSPGPQRVGFTEYCLDLGDEETHCSTNENHQISSIQQT